MQKVAQNLTYVLHICSWSLPFSHLPSVCPAPGFLVEKLDSMLEGEEVIKQPGKEFLSVLRRDSNIFTVCINIMNQIYWVNASLKSVSPINGMAHSVSVSDSDAFDIGEPVPAALPSPPSILIPVPQPGTSQTQSKKRRLLLHLAASSRWKSKRKNRNRNRRMMMEGMKVQVAKRKRTKNWYL